MEAKFFSRGDGGGDELLDGLEDEMELLVVVSVSFLEGFDFLGEQGVGIHQPPELVEDAWKSRMSRDEISSIKNQKSTIIIRQFPREARRIILSFHQMIVFF